MLDFEDYENREPAFIKHSFLKGYLETLFFRVGTKFDEIVYIDGFSGPWQNQDDKFKDTSFGIALEALRKVKAHFKSQGKNKKIIAHLVEKDPQAFKKLSEVPARYPDVEIKVYNNDFLSVAAEISKNVDKNCFCFAFVDPKGWKIDLLKLKDILQHKNFEIVFNFMFDFINRAANIDDPKIIEALNLLMPTNTDWRQEYKSCDSSQQRKEVIFKTFRQCLTEIGGYHFVSQIEVLKPTVDRTLYALFYATRNNTGIEVFRKHQLITLRTQMKIRGETKIKRKQDKTDQLEIFGNARTFGPDLINSFLQDQENAARDYILNFVPAKPNFIKYESLRLETLKNFTVDLPLINRICANLRKKGLLEFPEWEKYKKSPQPHYHVCKAN